MPFPWQNAARRAQVEKTIHKDAPNGYVGVDPGGDLNSSDPRLSDARVPLAHAASHGFAGSDPVSVLGLGGFPGGTTTFLRADKTFAVPAGGGTGDVVGPAGAVNNRVTAFDGVTGKLVKDSGVLVADVVLTSDARLTNARTPTAHAASHILGGSDPINPIVQTDALTGSVNNFALTAGCSLLLCNNATLRTYTGFVAGVDGQLLDIMSIGAGPVSLPHASASSSAGNRLTNQVTSAPIMLAPGKGVARYRYSSTAAAWLCLNHDQGAYLAVTFAAGDYTATAGAWTVDAGDVINVTYYVKGRLIFFNIVVNSTSVTATPAALIRTIPGGYTATANSPLVFFLGNPGGVFALCQMQVSGASLFFYSSISTAGTWSISTNSTSVGGSFACEVQ